MTIESAPMPSPAAATQNPPTARILVLAVVALFFIWGLATVLVDTLIPRFKALFTLTYTEVMLTQFSFFLAYFLFSLPAGAILARLGYLRAIVAGLAIMAAGCIMFVPAAALGVYSGFLLALFVMACGITLLQVAANPLITLLGSPQQAHGRLTLAQAFNSLGTTVGPLLGALLILGGDLAPTVGATLDADALAALRSAEAQELRTPFLGIACVLAAVAVVFIVLRRTPLPSAAQTLAPPGAMGRVLREPRLVLGAGAIFFYVGAEVSVGSILINYLMEPATLGLQASRAAQLVSLYWGGAMVGRFIGSAALRRSPAGLLLGGCAVAAALFCALSAGTAGMVAAVAVLAIGLCNSVMFPLIFSLAIEGLEADTPRGSAIVCMAIVGGALIPVVTGAAADEFGLGLSLLVPAACYLYVAGYGTAVQRGLLPTRVQR